MRNPSLAEPTAELAGRRWTFGPAVLDERSLELEVAGGAVKLERKPLEVLLYLLHHAGEVVTKDDLAEALWPGRILTETVLTRCISLLRTALQDDARTLIRTVHGFGYRLIADVRVEVSAGPSGPPALDFRPGDHPPQRPQWKLVERLGTGGHGEAWLARHEKTEDARVFKFAVDAQALSSLKREITLYRLLHDSLGKRTAIARIFEWNLTEPPYFIEMEHVAGGNLRAWSEAQGGLTAIPLPTRLELVARIADAVAAAHSVGALHKDLKPGNVLVHVENGTPTIRLCDFGSGGVLDPQRLEALGITRQGFTKTMSGTTSATPLYLAPEVIAGQPFTIQADIYSLGILLYQVVAGDLRKALAPGWEADVADELLREDIALAAAGNPAKRLTDAGQLAERLRKLEERREVRTVELAALRRVEIARIALNELRRTRVYALLLLLLTGVAAAGGVAAYRARNDAVAAAGTADAVSGFLMEDVLRVDASLVRPTETSYESLLTRAAAVAGSRLKGQPEAAAKVHWLLGGRLLEIGQFQGAATQLERALALFTAMYGRDADQTLMTLDQLARVYIENGRGVEALALSDEMGRLWSSRFPANDLGELLIRTRIAKNFAAMGEYVRAEKLLTEVLHGAANAAPASEPALMLFRQLLGVEPSREAASKVLIAYANLVLAGYVLDEVGDDYSQVESGLRGALATFSEVLGDESDLSAFTRYALAFALAEMGKDSEAEIHALKTAEYFSRSLPERHFGRGLALVTLGRIRIVQGRPTEARALLQDAVNLCASEAICPARVRAEFLHDLGRALSEAGNEQSAIDAFRASLDLQERVRGPAHDRTLKARIGLADALRQARLYEQSATVLSAIGQSTVADLRPYQQTRAELRRAEGLLFLETRRFGHAVSALRESLEIDSHRFGPAHWRVKLVRAELDKAIRAVGP